MIAIIKKERKGLTLPQEMSNTKPIMQHNTINNDIPIILI